MIEEYYKLIGNPFRLTPDSQFGFVHRSFSRARAYLRYALDRAEGFLMITGESGTGKTQLITDLFADLDRSKIHATLIADNQLSAEDMLRLLAMDYGIETQRVDKSTILNEIRNHLVAQYHEGRRAILVLDEAQGLDQSVLDELQMLSNFQVENHSLLQVFLIGQDGLRRILQDPKMEQLRQRMIATARIEALEEKETQEYIEYRLGVVGWHKDPAFDPAVFPLIHRYTHGVPRQINHLMSRLLLKGALEEKHLLDVDDMWEVLDELQGEPLLPTARDVSLTQFRAEYEASLAPPQDEEDEETPDRELPTLTKVAESLSAPAPDPSDRPVLRPPATPASGIHHADLSANSQPKPAVEPAPINPADFIRPVPQSGHPAPKPAAGATVSEEESKPRSGGGRVLRWMGYAAGLALVAGAISMPWIKQQFPALMDAVTQGNTDSRVDTGVEAGMDTAQIQQGETTSPPPGQTDNATTAAANAKATVEQAQSDRPTPTRIAANAKPKTQPSTPRERPKDATNDIKVSSKPVERPAQPEPTVTAATEAAPSASSSITVISAVSDAARAPSLSAAQDKPAPEEPPASSVVVPEPNILAKAETAVTPPARDSAYYKQAVMDGRWTSNGKPATLLPSSLNFCRDLGGSLSCDGIEQTTMSKHGKVKYLVEATLSDFNAEGSFQVVYRTKVALLKPEGDDTGLDWQISTHEVGCRLVDTNLIQCSSEKGQTREYRREP